MRISLSLATLRHLLLVALTFVIYSGFLAEVWQHIWRLPDPFHLVPFFDLSYEVNLPNWFSSSLLLSCGVLLALIALGARQATNPAYTRHWWVLSLAFLYISLDEYVQIHEQASRWFHFGGALYFGWVIPAAIVVAVLGLSYLRFLAHLPRKTRNRFILAGIIYVAGALVMELPLGYWTDRSGDDNFVYGMIDLVEESMEMIGASLFLYALVEHLGSPSRVLEIFVDGDTGAPTGRSVTRSETEVPIEAPAIDEAHFGPAPAARPASPPRSYRDESI